MKQNKNSEEKTNVMRVLESKKIAYISHSYEPDQTLTGEEIAGILGEDASKVFKTLVTQGKTGQYYVFVVPVQAELDLKMIKQKDLLPLTGYIHGGCSPIGMKKQFPTFIHETAGQLEKIYVSAGKVGFQVELDPAELIALTRSTLADIVE